VLDSPRASVLYVLPKAKFYGHFFFSKSTVSAITYVGKLEHWLWRQLREYFHRSLYFQQAGVETYFHLAMRAFFDNQLPPNWLGRGRPIFQPPRSADLSRLDLFFWGFVKYCLHTTSATVLARATSLPIGAAVLLRTAEEFWCGLAICRVNSCGQH
jgi:hypothetical protein